MFPWTGRKLISANSAEINPLGRCTARVLFENTSSPISWEFCILPHSPHQVILGWDILSSCEMTIDCGLNAAHSQFELSPEIDPVPTRACILLNEDVELLPRTASMVEVVYQGPLNTNDVIIEPRIEQLTPRDLVVPYAVANMNNEPFLFPIVNLGNSRCRLPCKMKLALVIPVETPGWSTMMSVSDEVPPETSDSTLCGMIDEKLDALSSARVLQLLQSFSSLFNTDASQVGRTNTTKHRIDTGDHQPIHQPPHRVSFRERRLIQQQVEEMLANDVIAPSTSPWASPVVLVKKKDGNWRFCVDYRKVNKITKKDVYPLPRIDDALDRLQGSTYFSSLDMASGYWQVEVDERDREKTAFITPDGLYEFQVMPFGLCNAPATFQRMMDLVLAGLKWTCCLVYLDDVVVFSTTFDEHLKRLESVLKCIQNAGLTLKPSKCRFAARDLRILGHVVNEDGVCPDPDKIRAVSEFPRPLEKREVKSFLGLCSYYRRFVQDFAKIARPLSDLTKISTPFTWDDNCEDAFQTLKAALTSAPVLAHFSDLAPTALHTDASGYGLGAVLTQSHKGQDRVVAYASRALTPAEKNYSTTEKECLAVVWAIAKFRPYLYGRPFSVVTDHHALCWLASLKDPNGRLARWALRLQEFDVTIIYKSGKHHADADCLSRSPVEEAKDSDDTDFLAVVSPASIVASQQQDEQVRDLFAHLEPGGEYRMEDGILMKRNFGPVGRPWLIVLPEALQDEAFSAYHDDPTAGHLGVQRTWDRIRRRFFWPGLRKRVKRYVTSCRECQRRKRPNLRPPGMLQPIPPADHPFQRVGIDLLGRFPTSTQGNRWVIVCTDYLTRYAVTRATPAGSAEEVSRFLLEAVILQHGAPSELLSDRGTVFLSSVVQQLEERHSIRRLLTSAYHPQTNGLVERLNRTMADMISMYVQGDQKNWDEVLPYVTFAYNTARQETTGFSPFFLLHGRDAQTPLDAMLPSGADPIEDIQIYGEQLAEQVENAQRTANRRTANSQKGSKERYDARHREVTYSPGDMVWVWTPIRRVGLSEKLLHRYFGPYRVVRQTSPVNYEVEPVDTEATSHRRLPRTEVVHVQRMKPYVSRNEDHPDAPPSDDDEEHAAAPELSSNDDDADAASPPEETIDEMEPLASDDIRVTPPRPHRFEGLRSPYLLRRLHYP